jgi:hypothetical protein
MMPHTSRPTAGLSQIESDDGFVRGQKNQKVPVAAKQGDHLFIVKDNQAIPLLRMAGARHITPALRACSG